ncbi:MAG: OB-fold domain-containing protein [Alphaproteobacteria bacterium]|nr:OB-fold domain-containing protein [Alphaproteobacteria bacterium]
MTATATQGVQAHYQEALAQGRFLIQHCDGCGRAVHYPREVCPHCGSEQLRFQPALGTGTVYAVTTVRRKPEAGGDLNVSLIDLDEGPRLMSRVVNLPPDQVRIGQRVRARVQTEPGPPLLVFDAQGAQP